MIAILKTFYSGAHRKCIDSVCNRNGSSQDYNVVCLAERILGSALPLFRTSTSNVAKAELSKSSRTQITLVTVFSFYCHLASASGA